MVVLSIEPGSALITFKLKIDKPSGFEKFLLYLDHGIYPTQRLIKKQNRLSNRGLSSKYSKLL
jgi:hypothetical protein